MLWFCNCSQNPVLQPQIRHRALLRDAGSPALSSQPCCSAGPGALDLSAACVQTWPQPHFSPLLLLEPLRGLQLPLAQPTASRGRRERAVPYLCPGHPGSCSYSHPQGSPAMLKILMDPCPKTLNKERRLAGFPSALQYCPGTAPFSSSPSSSASHEHPPHTATGCEGTLVDDQALAQRLVSYRECIIM